MSLLAQWPSLCMAKRRRAGVRCTTHQLSTRITSVSRIGCGQSGFHKIACFFPERVICTGVSLPPACEQGTNPKRLVQRRKLVPPSLVIIDGTNLEMSRRLDGKLLYAWALALTSMHRSTSVVLVFDGLEGNFCKAQTQLDEFCAATGDGVTIKFSNTYEEGGADDVIVEYLRDMTDASTGTDTTEIALLTYDKNLQRRVSRLSLKRRLEYELAFKRESPSLWGSKHVNWLAAAAADPGGAAGLVWLFRKPWSNSLRMEGMEGNRKKYQRRQDGFTNRADRTAHALLQASDDNMLGLCMDPHGHLVVEALVEYIDAGRVEELLRKLPAEALSELTYGAKIVRAALRRDSEVGLGTWTSQIMAAVQWSSLLSQPSQERTEWACEVLKGYVAAYGFKDAACQRLLTSLWQDIRGSSTPLRDRIASPLLNQALCLLLKEDGTGHAATKNGSVEYVTEQFDHDLHTVAEAEQALTICVWKSPPATAMHITEVLVAALATQRLHAEPAQRLADPAPALGDMRDVCATPPGGTEAKPLDRWTVLELKSRLRQLPGQPTGGSKGELVARLAVALGDLSPAGSVRPSHVEAGGASLGAEGEVVRRAQLRVLQNGCKRMMQVRRPGRRSPSRGAVDVGDARVVRMLAASKDIFDHFVSTTGESLELLTGHGYQNLADMICEAKLDG